MGNSPVPAGLSSLTARIDVFFTSLVEQGASSLCAADFAELAEEASRVQERPFAFAAARLGRLLDGSPLPLHAIDLHLRAGLENLRALVMEGDARRPPGSEAALPPAIADPEPEMRAATAAACQLTVEELLLQKLLARTEHNRSCLQVPVSDKREQAFIVAIAQRHYLVAVRDLHAILVEDRGSASRPGVVELSRLLHPRMVGSGVGRRLLLHAASAGSGTYFAVNGIVAQGEFTLHPLPRSLANHPVFSGCTVLEDGTVVLMLDLGALSECCSSNMRR